MSRVRKIREKKVEEKEKAFSTFSVGRREKEDEEKEEQEGEKCGGEREGVVGEEGEEVRRRKEE